MATDRGGAVSMQAGNLGISNTSFAGNQVLVASPQDVGTGGALAVIDGCSSGGCPFAAASVQGSIFVNNFAYQAGGAVYFDAGNPGRPTYCPEVKFGKFCIYILA